MTKLKARMHRDHLVGLSAARTKRLYGLVYPRDTWWMRLFNQARTVMSGIMRTPMRFYVYSAAAVDAVVRAQGLERLTSCEAGVWQVILYARSAPFTPQAGKLP